MTRRLLAILLSIFWTLPAYAQFGGFSGGGGGFGTPGAGANNNYVTVGAPGPGLPQGRQLVGTTPITVVDGGPGGTAAVGITNSISGGLTGGTTAAGARTSLGAAASGTNTDITQLDGANILSSGSELITSSTTISGTKGHVNVSGAGITATLPAFSTSRKSLITIFNSNSSSAGPITLAASGSDEIWLENAVSFSSIKIPVGQSITLICVDGTPYAIPHAIWGAVSRTNWDIHRVTSTTTNSPTINSGVEEYTSATGCVVSLPSVVGQTSYFKGYKNTSSTGTVTLNAFAGEFIMDFAGGTSTTYSLPPNSSVLFSSSTAGTDGHKVIAESISTLPVSRGGTNLTTTGANGNVLTASGGVWVSAAPSTPTQTIASFVAAGTAIVGFNKADSTGGSFTLTLPLAATTTGQTIDVKYTGSANSVIVDGDGAETIDGAADFTLSTLYPNVTVISDGTQYFIK